MNFFTFATLQANKIQLHVSVNKHAKMQTSRTFAKCLISTPASVCLTIPDIRSPQKKSFITTKGDPVWKDRQVTSRGAICWDCQGTTIFRWTEIIAMWVKNDMVPRRIVKTWNDDKSNLTRNVYCKVLQGLWSFAYNIPTHRAARPLQVPFAWHILVDDPLGLNPGSHLNITLFGKTVESPKDEPFMGTDKGPQSTATRKQKETVCTSKQDSMKQEIRKL